VVECFCGCGRSVWFRRRSANAIGSMIALQLERLEERRAAFGPDARRTSALTPIIREGTRVRANLQAYVHHEPADPRLAKGEAARWLRFVQHL
jgi:hypothetical protein